MSVSRLMEQMAYSLRASGAAADGAEAALAMGMEGMEAYARAEQCSRGEAQRRLRFARQRGRQPSRVMEALCAPRSPGG
jgi:hypothetical protein